MKGWLKFAILGSTYARALENAATRTGRPMTPGMTSAIEQIRGQTQPRLQRGLGSVVREHAASVPLQLTPEQQGMQRMLAKVPWAGAEHGGHGDYAEQQLNARLRQRGLEYNTPAGQPSTHQQIAQAFGPPRRAPEDPVTRKVPYKGQGPSPFLLMDRYKVPGAIGAPDRGTHVGPAPAPSPGQASSSEHVVPQPHAGEHTQVAGGPWRPGWQRFSAPAPGAVPPPVQRQPAAIAGGRSATPMESTAVLPRKVASLPIAAGVGIPLAVGGALLARKPGVQASMRALQEGGSTQERDIAGAIPQEALDQAGTIHQALLAHGLDPASVRMGIDAPPGSGKTTLAKAIQQKTGIKHYGLDWLPGNALHSTIGLGRNIEKMPRAPHAGEVLEHYMLGRTYDPELFDAMIHISRDPSVLQKQLQQRGHGAYIGDLMDLNKSLGVADLGFETLGGETIDLGNGVQMKLRPHEGWGDALDQRLMQAGIDPTGLSRHEKLLSLHAGKRTTGAGWTPYVKSPFSGGEAAVLGASVPLGVMAAKALARRPR